MRQLPTLNISSEWVHGLLGSWRNGQTGQCGRRLSQCARHAKSKQQWLQGTAATARAVTGRQAHGRRRRARRRRAWRCRVLLCGGLAGVPSRHGWHRLVWIFRRRLRASGVALSSVVSERAHCGSSDSGMPWEGGVKMWLCPRCGVDEPWCLAPHPDSKSPTCLSSL